MEFRHSGTDFPSGNFDLKYGTEVVPLSTKTEISVNFSMEIHFFFVFFFDLKYGRKSRKTRKIKKPFSMNPILKYGIFVKFNDFIKIF